jgi:hypothetical protein
MLGSNPGQLRLRQWLSDALASLLDLVLSWQNQPLNALVSRYSLPCCIVNYFGNQYLYLFLSVFPISVSISISPNLLKVDDNHIVQEKCANTITNIMDHFIASSSYSSACNYKTNPFLPAPTVIDQNTVKNEA